MTGSKRLTPAALIGACWTVPSRHQLASCMTPPPTLWATSVLMPYTSLHLAFAERLTQVISSHRLSTRGLSRSALDKQDAAALWMLECLYQGFSCVPQAA